MGLFVTVFLSVLFLSLALIVYFGRRKQQWERERTALRRLGNVELALPSETAGSMQESIKTAAGLAVVIRKLEDLLTDAGVPISALTFLGLMSVAFVATAVLMGAWLHPAIAVRCGLGLGSCLCLF